MHGLAGGELECKTDQEQNVGIVLLGVYVWVCAAVLDWCGVALGSFHAVHSVHAYVELRECVRWDRLVS